MMMQQKYGAFLWCSALITSMAEKKVPTAPTREDTVLKYLEYTVITTEDNGIVIYASGFCQGAYESTTTTPAFTFYEMDRP